MTNEAYAWTDADDAALRRYNAGWGDPNTRVIYKSLHQSAQTANEDDFNENILMNLAIDAALELCGHAFYRGRSSRFIVFAAGVSELCLCWAHQWLVNFERR